MTAIELFIPQQIENGFSFLRSLKLSYIFPRKPTYLKLFQAHMLNKPI